VVRPVPAAIDTLRARRDWEIEVGWPKAGEEIERQRPETRTVGAPLGDWGAETPRRGSGREVKGSSWGEPALVTSSKRPSRSSGSGEPRKRGGCVPTPASRGGIGVGSRSNAAKGIGSSSLTADCRG
jgi:hypothetical protein